MTPVAGVLLAAGGGHRFGSPKALIELQGSTLLERGTCLLREAGCGPVVVVLGAEAQQCRDLLAGADAQAEVVVAADWEEGMAASLRAGLGFLATTQALACVVALVDQPMIGAAAVGRLASLAGTVEAAVATYRGEPRNPVLLDRAVWPELLALTGDTGARGWLRAHPERVRLVPCDDTGSPEDIDTLDDLEALRTRLSP